MPDYSSGRSRCNWNTNVPTRSVAGFEHTAANIAAKNVISPIPIRRMRCEIHSTKRTENVRGESPQKVLDDREVNPHCTFDAVRLFLLCTFSTRLRRSSSVRYGWVLLLPFAEKARLINNLTLTALDLLTLATLAILTLATLGNANHGFLPNKHILRTWQD